MSVNKEFKTFKFGLNFIYNLLFGYTIEFKI